MFKVKRPKSSSRLSGGLPRLTGLEHGVHDGQHLVHARHDDDLGHLAGELQPLGKLGDDGVVADGGVGGHVQHASNVGTSAPDVSASVALAAVVGQRSQAHELGNLAPVEPAEFGAQAEHRTAEHGAHAGDAAQQVVLGAPDLGVAQPLAHVLVQPLDSLVQPGDMFGQALAHGARGGGVPTLQLLHPHVHQLPAARQQVGQVAGVGVVRCTGLRANRLGEGAQDVRVEGVRLGQFARSTRKLTYLARVDDGQSYLAGGQFGGKALLEAAAGVHHHQRRRQNQRLCNRFSLASGGGERRHLGVVRGLVQRSKLP